MSISTIKIQVITIGVPVVAILIMSCFTAFGQRTTLSTLYAFDHYEIQNVNCAGNASVVVIGNLVEINILDFPNHPHSRQRNYQRGVIVLHVVSGWKGNIDDWRIYDCIDEDGNSRCISFLKENNSIVFKYCDRVADGVWQPFITLKGGQQISMSGNRTDIKPIM